MKAQPLRRLSRGLRFRLTLSYAALFTVLLIFVGMLFRQTLSSILYTQLQELLEEEWRALHGFLRFEKGQPQWYFDREDPEESLTVNRLKLVFLLADSTGRVKEVSDIYRRMGIDSQAELRSTIAAGHTVWRRRHSDYGAEYLVRYGVFEEGAGQRYLVALGRSLAASENTVNRFTWNYLGLLPALVSLSLVLGWVQAGRTLRPVTAVARAAEKISGQNLRASVPSRGAGDELDHLIAAFNRMVDRLADSFEQIRHFSTDVSHELRTPLTSIRGQLEVALMTARSEAELREAIESALEDVERLSAVVRELLRLSQAESGQLALKFRPVDLTALARAVVEQYGIPAEAASIHLCLAPSAPCVAEVDSVQIDRLLSNLVSNAIKYTPSGGRVDVRVERVDHEARLTVADTGRGIPAADLPHIFNRFYRVRSHTEAKGLGLGLSFVSWIAKAHGGHVEVESEVGKGTTFLVTLPLARA